MNDFQKVLPPADDDRMLEEAFSVLKRLDPPLTARIANRRAVATALAEMLAVNRQREKSWWRRSVSVPAPLVGAAVLLIAVLAFFSFGASRTERVQVVALPAQAEARPDARPDELRARTNPQANDAAPWKQYQSGIYLCGVGQVSSETYVAARD